VFIGSSAVTGAAVLRVAGRVFMGRGPAEGPGAGQARSARETDDEVSTRRDFTPPMMIVVPVLLLAGALAVGLIPGAVPAIEHAAIRFTDHRAYARWVLYGRSVRWPALAPSHISADDVLYSAISILGALGTAAVGLFGRPLRRRAPALLSAPWLRALHALRDLHSGHIGDYIAWWTAAASLLGATCLLALT